MKKLLLVFAVTVIATTLAPAQEWKGWSIEIGGPERDVVQGSYGENGEIVMTLPSMYIKNMEFLRLAYRLEEPDITEGEEQADSGIEMVVSGAEDKQDLSGKWVGEVSYEEGLFRGISVRREGGHENALAYAASRNGVKVMWEIAPGKVITMRWVAYLVVSPTDSWNDSRRRFIIADGPSPEELLEFMGSM